MHIDTADCGLPVTAVVTSASLHDSQVAIPMMKMTSGRVMYCYDLMDAAYDAELISNAVKHAFPPGSGSGMVSVSIRQSKSGEVEMVVRDSGIGMPEGAEIFNATSFGLRLVVMLVQQIGGALEQLKEGGGTEFRIRFKTFRGIHQIGAGT